MVRLRTYLLLLVLAGLLPVVLFAIGTGFFFVQEQRATFRSGVEERTQAVLTAVDAELSGQVERILVLSKSESLARGDFATFRRSAQRVLESQPGWDTINVASAAGERILDLLVPEGEPLRPITTAEDSFARLTDTGAPVVGNLAIGPTTGRWDYAVRAPILVDGEIRYVLTAVISPDAIGRLIAAQDLSADWLGGVLDANGRIVARTQNQDETLGQPGAQSVLDALQRASHGWFLGDSLEGEDVYIAYRQSPVTGWTFAIGVPPDVVNATAIRAFVLLAIGLVGALALALVSASLISRRLVQPIAALEAVTERVSRGERVTIPQIPDVAEIATFGRTLASTLATLHESETRFRDLANAAPAILWVTHPDARIAFISRSWFEYTGHSAEQAYGDDGFGWLLAVHPEDRERSAQVHLSANARREEFALDYRLRRADGTYRWAIDAGKPYFDGAGTFLGYVGAVIDIDDRKRAEEALREADRHKDDFLATLGHELRNPLAALSNAAKVLKARGGEDAKIAAVHDVIDRQTQHMVRLIEDLLDMSRIRLGKVNLQKAPLELGKLVTDATQSKRSAGNFAGRARVELTVESVWINADAARIEQVYVNLLDNALKFTPASGSIQVMVRSTEAGAELRVRDDGQGIAAEVLPYIFRIFVQGEQPGRTHGGLGLGLALVRRLVELHDGVVRVESEGRGRGATFIVTLPAMAAPALTANSTAAVAAKPAASLRVLLIEDNDDVRETARVVLELDGHILHEACTGAEGLALAAHHEPDVILIDIGLPDMDGYEVARRLRAGATARQAVLIALSGHGEDTARARAAGFDAHRTKPVAVDEVIASLGEFLQKRKDSL